MGITARGPAVQKCRLTRRVHEQAHCHRRHHRHACGGRAQRRHRQRRRRRIVRRWPGHLPLPTDPGTVVSQSSTTAVVRSTDAAAVVRAKLDDLYVTQKGCTRQLAVNRPRDYLCFNAATGKTDEVVFTFASLDPTDTDPSPPTTFLIGETDPSPERGRPPVRRCAPMAGREWRTPEAVRLWGGPSVGLLFGGSRPGPLLMSDRAHRRRGGAARALANSSTPGSLGSGGPAAPPRRWTRRCAARDVETRGEQPRVRQSVHVAYRWHPPPWPRFGKGSSRRTRVAVGVGRCRVGGREPVAYRTPNRPTAPRPTASAASEGAGSVPGRRLAA